jgi:hypothetical protein
MSDAAMLKSLLSLETGTSFQDSESAFVIVAT